MGFHPSALISSVACDKVTLSPYLFVVAVETLATAIRQNSDQIQPLQYADDTTTILADTNSSDARFRLLESF